jgi:hypothetical protein
VLGRPLARVGDAEDVLGTEGVDRDGGDDRGVDPAGQPEQHAGEAVLGHVVAQSEHDRLVPLAEIVPPLGHRRLERLVRGERLSRDDRALDAQPLEPGIGVRHRGGGGRKLQVDHQQLGLELGGAAHQVTLGVDDQRVAVEDELVLAADQVDVGECAGSVTRSAGAQLEPVVVLG